MDVSPISNDTTILVSVGTLITVFGAVAKLIYNYARMELSQEFMKKDITEAHQKIRDLSKKN
jgi:hypothetical protein